MFNPNALVNGSNKRKICMIDIIMLGLGFIVDIRKMLILDNYGRCILIGEL
jgi:hypothetical protein